MTIFGSAGVLVYEPITCVRRANENARSVIFVVQFLINIYMQYDGNLTLVNSLDTTFSPFFEN